MKTSPLSTLHPAGSSSSAASIKLSILGDGNCALNTLAVNLIANARAGILDILPLYQANDILKLMDIVAELHPELGLLPYANLSKRFEDFEQKLRNSHDQFDWLAAQKVMARAMRVQFEKEVTNKESFFHEAYVGKLGEVLANAAEIYIDANILHEPFNSMPAFSEKMAEKLAEIRSLGMSCELTDEKLTAFIKQVFPGAMKEYFINEGGLALYLHNQTLDGDKKGIADPGIELGVYELEVLGQMYGMDIDMTVDMDPTIQQVTTGSTIPVHVQLNGAHWDTFFANTELAQAIQLEYLEQREKYNKVASSQAHIAEINANLAQHGTYAKWHTSDLSFLTEGEFRLMNKLLPAVFASNAPVTPSNYLEACGDEAGVTEEEYTQISNVLSIGQKDLDAKSIGLGAPAYLGGGAGDSSTTLLFSKIDTAVLRSQFDAFMEKHNFHPSNLDVISDKLTPLTKAIFDKNDLLSVRLLIMGANPTQANGYGRTPDYLANKYGSPFIQALVQQAIEKPELFAALRGFLVADKFDIDDLDKANKSMITPLTKAVRDQRTDLVELLLTLGCDPTLANGIPRTPLQLAKKYGGPEIEALITSAIESKAATSITPTTSL